MTVEKPSRKGLELYEPGLGGKGMLETIAIILLVLWLLGMVTGQTFGGVLHAIIVVAIVIFFVRVLTGRRVV